MAANGLCRDDILVGTITYHYRFRGFKTESLDSQAEDLGIGFADSYYTGLYYGFEEVIQSELCQDCVHVAVEVGYEHHGVPGM